VLSVTLLDFQLLQGSVAAYCRWGDVYIENFLANHLAKEFRKSVHICQSYYLTFTGTQCSFCTRNIMANFWGVPLNWGVECRWVWKIAIFDKYLAFRLSHRTTGGCQPSATVKVVNNIDSCSLFIALDQVTVAVANGDDNYNNFTQLTW